MIINKFKNPKKPCDIPNLLNFGKNLLCICNYKYSRSSHKITFAAMILEKK